MPVHPVEPGYHTANPYITVIGAAKAIEFYKAAFSATEKMRMVGPDGSIMHAEIKIGDSPIMLSDEFPDWGVRSPQTIGGSGSSIMLMVPNVDELFAQAIAAGATEIMPPADQFWGDRMGKLSDPFGHIWSIMTHIEDVSHEEMKSRMDAMFAAPAA
jgi:PhnB protein